MNIKNNDRIRFFHDGFSQTGKVIKEKINPGGCKMWVVLPDNVKKYHHHSILICDYEIIE